MDRPLFALCALLLNIALAGPRQWYETLGLTSLSQMPPAMLRKAERKLNREHRSLEERKWRGDILTGLVLAGSIFIGLILDILSRHDLEFIQILALTPALPIRPTWDRVSAIRASLYAGNNEAAHKALDGTPWRHHALLDAYGLARAGIETLAVNFADKIVAPLFWYFLLGLPGLFSCKAIGLMEETLTQPGARRFASGFGQAAQLVHHWMNFLPARLAAILWLIVSACLPARHFREMAKELAGGITTNETPQIVSLAAAASVLKLMLGGPLSLYAQDKWIGSGTPKPMPGDIKRALNSFALLCLLLFILLGIFL